MPRFTGTLAVLLALAALPAGARGDERCDAVVAKLGDRVADVECFASDDLTTNGAATTPANNSLPGWPPFAFTPQVDRTVISLGTPIVAKVPGVQLEARFADDPTGQARFLLRLPDDWNGRLVVAGASGTRSEFNGDWAWSDYVLQKGYAYASQNKGVLNFRQIVGYTLLSPPPPSDPLACRLNPVTPFWVHFYDLDPEKPFTEWQTRIVDAARLARDGVLAAYRRPPRFTYAVGTSNGGYQVRRAVEEAPDLFDGGVDWEGTFVQPGEDNLLVQLPVAVRWFPAYVASGYDPASAAAQAMLAAGYPPDLVNRDASGAVTASMWGNYWAAYWELTQCQWQKRLDPTYDTYGSGVAAYDYFARAATTDVAANLAAFATTGKIKKPLVTVAGTMDALLPIVHHARAYAEAVAASRKGDEAHRSAQYRLYEVQNGNHIESYVSTFPRLRLVQPHAHAAFDALVGHVETGTPLPPDQCIGTAGALSPTPAQPGRCASLLE